MKAIKVPKIVFRAIVLIPLVAMGLSLYLAYVQYTQPAAVVLPQHIGTLTVDTDWRAQLKQNPFFASHELNSDYGYVSALVDQISIDLSFAFSNGVADAPTSIAYAVDGALLADYGAANSTVLLLKQDYPSLAGDKLAFAGPSYGNDISFPVQLSSYEQVIDSFEAAYQVSVNARLELYITVVLDTTISGQVNSEDMQMTLTIPLGTTVFEIQSTPSGSIDLYLPTDPAATPEKPAQQLRLFLIIAGGMMLLALLIYLLIEPIQPDPKQLLLKQALKKFEGRMVAVESDLRDGAEKALPVSDMAGLLCIADESGQPILHWQQGDSHLFFVLVQGMLYTYALDAGASAGAEPPVPPAAPDAGE